MKRDFQLVLIALLGVIAIHAWGFGFSWVFYKLFLLSGSPQHPIAWQFYLATIGISFFFGFLGGLASWLFSWSVRREAIIFFLVAALSSFLASTLVLVGLGGITAQVTSCGFWGFLLGALVSFAIRRRIAA